MIVLFPQGSQVRGLLAAAPAVMAGPTRVRFDLTICGSDPTALGAWGGPMVWTDYEPVPSWITGMGAASSLAPVDAVRVEG